MDKRLEKLFWYSRNRGMLELDLVLTNYLKHFSDSMTSVDIAEFEALLTAEDQDMFDWFFHHKQPDIQHSKLVKEIVGFCQNPSFDS